ncbi:hypothetical protein M8C21_010722 [Ambrosia artemisiifolia]|uniref:Bifunctional inhibitor/plant lipid transfer protein/seed storage helical domain-containing protein n=1 Tax=Ambrosia artemisiifolia TaxID=4212 RepID=A0AAD5CDC8_AMBAR|nr:hypothetical protein M8C21_010722 [Ambrosia artemisiifolia]
MKNFSLVVLCALAMVLLVGNVQKTNAQTCNAQDLISCAGPLFFGTQPSSDCCTKLRAAQPCFCDFIRDPSFGQYINSPNARKLATACGVTIPTTCP